LPGTKTEIEKVKAILEMNNWPVDEFTGEEANEDVLKAAMNPKVLHIATHGYFLDAKDDKSMIRMGLHSEESRQDPMMRSGLLLTGASDFIQDKIRQTEENGILTAYEAANLNLDQTELVVLSACETGAGEIQNGEGVYGLQRAFQTAGTQSLLMSLWKVDDAATQKLMSMFYENWMSGKDKDQSFKDAQLSLMKEYKHPYYWGAFVMMSR
jgi:CHAT domain-containing protein